MNIYKIMKFFAVLLLVIVSTTSSAVTKSDADSAYVRQQYQDAIKYYEALLKKGVSADIYYNLGNAYYRTDNMPRAVLNYERALLLQPGDRDIRFNLQLARSKTIDKIIPESEMFFVTWYHSLLNTMSVDGWASFALICLALSIVLFLVYLFTNQMWQRKIGFFGALLLMVLFLFSNAFAWQQKQVLAERSRAIVMSGVASIKSTPAVNGTDLFVLHEGTPVEIIDGTMSQWLKVKIADGKEGWIEEKDIEKI